jgi:hypothetical protein
LYAHMNKNEWSTKECEGGATLQQGGGQSYKASLCIKMSFSSNNNLLHTHTRTHTHTHTHTQTTVFVHLSN